MGNGIDSTRLVQTKCGTVPGTALADMLFTYICPSGECAAAAARLTPSDAASPTPASADDIAVMLPFCPSLVEFHSRSMGVSLNFDPGQTAAVCVFRGPGLHAARRLFLRSEHPTVLVELQSGVTVSLRLVQSYAHLGSVVSHCSSSPADDKTKMGLAAPCFRRLQSTLLCNPELSKEEKVAFISFLIVAKVGFGSALWCPTTPRETASCHNAISRWESEAFRPVTGQSSKLISDEEVCYGLGMPTPEQYLRAARVRQPAVVALQGAGFLWSAGLEAEGWVRLAFAAAAEACKALDADLWTRAPTKHHACLLYCQKHHAA